MQLTLFIQPPHVAQARGPFEILGLETLFETIRLAPMQERISDPSQKYKRSRGVVKMLLNLLDFSDQSERLIGLKCS